jgi:4-hydroxybenzoate polyprenyltransferase
MQKKVMGFARLARPANLPTAAADIFAGVVLGLFLEHHQVFTVWQEHGITILCLVASSVLLYAGGVVLNDVFDAQLDAVERPERTIPQGIVTLPEAIVWGVLLLLSGVVFAFMATLLSGLIAMALAGAILLYDGYAKKFGFLGPLTMGVCRGLNLLLGLSVLGHVSHWWLGFVPVAYIFAVTLISRGEVHGNNKNHILWSGMLYMAVILAMGWSIDQLGGHLSKAFPFFVLFSVMLMLPLLKAYRENSPQNIKKRSFLGSYRSLLWMSAGWPGSQTGHWPH